LPIVASIIQRLADVVARAAGSGRTGQVVGLGVIVVLALIGATLASRQDTGSAGTAAGLERGRVGALGRIEPESEIIHIGGPADERLISLHVVEGDFVTAGQVLGRLSSHDERVADQKAAAAALRDAQLRVQKAQELYPIQIRAQEARLRSFTAELDNNRDILKARTDSRAFQTRRAIDDQAALVRQNEEAVARERDELNRLAKEMQLERLSAAAAMERAGAEAARAEARLREVALTAPIDGQILKIFTRVGGRVGDSPVISMGNTKAMHAVAEVYETDVRHVRVGQRAVVTSRALAAPLTGKVVKIGHMIFKNDVLGTDPAARIDARVVEVRILLDDSTAAASLTNLTVDVVIDTSGAAADVVAGARPRE
jgi:HlyD family secretion protein